MKPVAATALAICLALSAADSSSAAVRWFHSPTGNIQCQVSAHDTRGTAAYCQTFKPGRSVTLSASGALKTCHGAGCLGNGPEDAFTLKYGRSVTVGPFRCTSLQSGMRCVVKASGRGFLLSRKGVKRI
jgi:hypothetical protein